MNGITKPIHWHYEQDKPLIENIKFMEWFAKLKSVPLLEVGYGEPLEEGTGMQCWYEYYETGYSPEEAASEDMSYWEPTDD